MFGWELTRDNGDATASFVQILLDTSDASCCPDRIVLVEHK